MLHDVAVLMHEQTWFFLLFVLLVGLAVGSFLNVVIYRLPKMMQIEWRTECRVLLNDELKNPNSDPEPVFNLIKPDSTCPKCQQKIKPWHNIPVLSWLMLKGRCAYCDTHISPRYPIIEALTGIVSLVVAYHFGVTDKTFLFLLLTWCLIALTFIDIDHMLLPDQMTLPLVWLGLIASVLGITIAPSQAIIGAATGYLSLWSVYWLFKLVTGKEGMGYGDFKLLAVFGAFLGWQSILTIILLSSVVGAVIGILQLSIQGKDKATPIPFGPYLAIAGWITLLWGETIRETYLSLMVL